MRILFLPNWEIKQSDSDIKSLQSPDKYIKGQRYWFFQHFPEDTHVDVIDIKKNNLLHGIERKIKFYIRQSLSAFRNDSQYDIVISHGAQSGLAYSLLRTIRGKQKPKHVIIDIGGMNGSRNNRVESKLISFALKSNSGIICHSSIIIEFYKETYPRLVSLTKFIPFGVDTNEFAPTETNESENYIFSFGTSKRDYETLLKSWKLINNKADCRLKIAGIKEHLHAQGDNTVDLLGIVSINELKLLIRKSKFVVIPLPVFNYSYGQMSFLQSMSLGKTVVVTKTPSSVDYIKNEYGAFFVKPYDVYDLKNKIEMLLCDEYLLMKNNVNARLYVADNYTEKKMGENIYEYIKTIVDK
jgi:glycosyltransferase involved in cell wall biosynthesis